MKTLVITGASRGIGLELVKQIMADEAGVHVIACARNPSGSEGLKSISPPAGSKLSLVTLDQNAEESVKVLKRSSLQIAYSIGYRPLPRRSVVSHLMESTCSSITPVSISLRVFP